MGEHERFGSKEPPLAKDSEDLVVKPQANRDVAALFSNLHLQHNHYQPFSRRKIATAVALPSEVVPLEITTPPLPTERKRVHVGIFSPAGGTGKSTLTAGLGSVLCQEGKRVLLVDGSPWQSLAFHFGAKESRSGQRTFFAPGSRGMAVHLLASNEAEQAFPDLDEFAAKTPVDYVLFDLSGVSGERLLAYLRECDRILVPLLPDSSALRLATIARKIVDSAGVPAARLRFVLNGMDDSEAAETVHEQLALFLDEQLFPSVILNQVEVRRAQADGVVLPFHAPESQATIVFGELTRWITSGESVVPPSIQRWSEG